MKSRDITDYLQDILDAIDDVENFTVNMTYEQFAKDRKPLTRLCEVSKL